MAATYNEYRERASHGLEVLTTEMTRDYLIEHFDPEQLDLGDEEDCVLGQAFYDHGDRHSSGYQHGLAVLGIAHDDAWVFGFHVPDEEGSHGMELQETAWLHVLGFNQ